MANNNVTPAQVQEISELRNRVEWLDEERRKSLRRLAELEQASAAQTRRQEQRDTRIGELENQIAGLKGQIARTTQIDNQLKQFKDEIVQMIEQYDQRRVAAQDEIERRRRVEVEVQTREMADIRKELPAIPRLQADLELRQSEETRLAHMIGVLQNRVNVLDSRLEEQARDIAYATESEKQNNRQITDVQASIHEVNRRWEPIYARLDGLAASVTRAENGANALTEDIEKVRQTVNSWAEQVQLGEYQRNQKLEDWKRLIEDQQNIIEQFRAEWIKISDQYKESKMAVQTMGEWQKHMEGQQHEISEMTRVEASRMRARWDEFLLESEKRWKNSNVDLEQRQAALDRFRKQVVEELHAIDETLTQITQDKDLIWRVQSAQADALKQLPRIWLEEVEKAIANNPNRRRQPTLVPVMDEELNT